MIERITESLRVYNKVITRTTVFKPQKHTNPSFLFNYNTLFIHCPSLNPPALIAACSFLSTPVPSTSSLPDSTPHPTPTFRRDPALSAAWSCTAGILEIPNYGRKCPNRSNPTQTRTDPTPKSFAAASFRPDTQCEAAQCPLPSVRLEFHGEFPPFSPLFLPFSHPLPLLPSNSLPNLPSNSILLPDSIPNSTLLPHFAANSLRILPCFDSSCYDSLWDPNHSTVCLHSGFVFASLLFH